MRWENAKKSFFLCFVVVTSLLRVLIFVPLPTCPLIIMAAVTPFECPICFENYGSGSTAPTTFPCGHSCCLKHAPHLNGFCFSCRIPIPRLSILKTSISLRDGAELYFSTLTQMKNEEKNRPIIVEKSSFSITESTTTSDVIESCGIIIHHQASLAAAASEEEKSSSTKKSLIFHIPSATSSPPVPPPRQAQKKTSHQQCIICHQDKPLNSFNPQDRSATIATCKNCVRQQKVAVMRVAYESKRVDEGGRKMKTCGHECEMSLSQCCGCSDKRGHLHGNRYCVYVDGEGYKNVGSRGQYYCPTCKY